MVLISHSGKDQSKGMRGWSGTKAAADAEIEVTRNGDFRAATVTKLKDAGDFEQFSFKLNVVQLGLDSDGEPMSSCVVEHIDNAPEARHAKKRPTKMVGAMLEVLEMMAPSGTVNVEDLDAGYAKKFGGTPRTLRTYEKRQALIAAGWAFMHDEDRIGLTNIKQLDEEPSWLSE